MDLGTNSKARVILLARRVEKTWRLGFRGVAPGFEHHVAPGFSAARSSMSRGAEVVNDWSVGDTLQPHGTAPGDLEVRRGRMIGRMWTPVYAGRRGRRAG